MKPNIRTSLAVLPLAAGSILAASPSDLDPEFGTGGRVVFEQSADYERWDDVVAFPNGDVAVAGWTMSLDWVIANHIVRLNSRGEPVLSFGNQGEITLNLERLSGSSNSGSITDLVALPDGKLLAVVGGNYTLEDVTWTRISVLRLQANGSLDPSFGGDGMVEIETLASNIQAVTEMSRDTEGRIVLAGSASGSGSKVALIRLTPEGHLDSTFSGDGIAQIWVSGYPHSMAIQPDGKIVIAGNTPQTIDDRNTNWMVCRILADGNLDPDFADSGTLVLDIHGGCDYANAVCFRPNGKIIVAGSAVSEPGEDDGMFYKSLFVGLDENGALDGSFGPGGIVEIDVSVGLMDGVSAATLMPDGRLVAGCTINNGEGTMFAAMRLMPNGEIDSTFANGGHVRIPGTETPGGGDYLSDIALDPSGGILLIGGGDNPEGRGGVLVRLKGDPDSDGDGVVDACETNTGVYVSFFDTGTDPGNRDSDGDGLSDGDEVFHHSTNPVNPDTDGDGFADGCEVLTGKSPLDPLDRPALVAEVRAAVEFTFPSAIGKSYRIEGSPDTVEWAPVESGIPGTGQVIQRFYSTRNQPKRFLRVEEEVAP